MPSTSIIIPCFNAERFVGEAIASALRQTYPAIDIIVADDGSTDNSRSIVESFGSRVRLDASQHRGASAARNRGTRLAQGEFLLYLDADDVLAPDAVARRVDALQRADADVAYADWQKLVERPGQVFEPDEIVARTSESVHPDAQIAAFTDFWCPPAALLYHRHIVQKIGGWSESLPVIQDARFLLDAALHGGRFVHVPGVGAFYRVHASGSLSRRSSHAFLRDCLENALQVEAWWRGEGPLTREREQALLKVLFYVARGSYEGDKVTFHAAWRAARRIRPGAVPPDSPALACLSRMIGYPRAEAYVAVHRRVRAALARHLRT